MLLLDFSRDNSSTQHVVEGWLKSGGSGVPNRTVTVKVNDDAYSRTTRNGDGYFNLTLDLQPKIPNGQSAYQTVTYNIQASFAGDTPVNATAWANMLDGTSYAACTTTQYGYKPSCNSTALTVTPQSTMATMLTKTPEQMQKDAEASGWFRVDTEFSWWCPWFRLHYKLNVDLPQGNPALDYGWSPLPLGCSCNANIAAVANVMNSATEGSDPQALATFFGAATVPFLIQAAAAILAGQTVAGIGWAVALYAIALGVLTLWTCINANGNSNYWLMAFLGAAFAGMAELFIPPSGATGVIVLLKTVARGAFTTVQSALQTVLDDLGFLSVTGAIFALMDFVAMGFYLLVYLRSL